MQPEDVKKLRSLTSFEALIDYLRDDLDWPIEVEDAEEITFEYAPEELGIDPKYAVKIENIRQIRPLAENQPWGIFYIEFESKRLPVVVLRRILKSLVPKSRHSDPDRPVWRMSDLLFISAQGEQESRSISFAHFQQMEGKAAELRTFSWDSRETHFYYIKNLNLDSLRWPEDEGNRNAWCEKWQNAFTVEHRYTINKSQELARLMAHHATLIRDMVTEVFELETEGGPLHLLFKGFRDALLHDLNPESFADMVAQTVAYGLFSAATQTDDLSFDQVVDLIPNTNPFLKDLLAELTTEGAVDLEELGVGQLVEMIRQTDVEAILQDFGRQTGGGREDPVVHFYELFLNEYDKSQKVERGVFYTPDPVVSYIVRSVDHLIKTGFGLDNGLASINSYESSGEPIIQILDPATGTGTFLTYVIYEIEKKVKTNNDIVWNDYVEKHLLPRLNGFELMMAPYAIAHMKLGLKLKHTGYDFASNERLHIYLTNSLEKPVEEYEAMVGFLSKESGAAANVKRNTPITIVIGNPPYSVSSANKGEYINKLMENYKKSVREERNIQPLSDDYIKFIRFAHDRIERTGFGIIGFITNHAFLSGLIHRGMREELLSYFDDIYVLDLHGNSSIGETTPDGGVDKNVFDIKQGVAISFFIKNRKEKREFNVKHADLWGLREVKYKYLTENDVSTTVWSNLTPSDPNFYLIPKDYSFHDEYELGWSIDELFPISVNGIKTHRDNLVLDIDELELKRRIESLRDSSLTDEEIKKRLDIKDTRTWNLSEARKKLFEETNWQDYFTRCLYRPYDIQSLYYHDALIDRSRRNVMQHMQAGNNLALINMRQYEYNVSSYCYAFVTKDIAECRIFISNRGIANITPLYIYPDGRKPQKEQTLLFTNDSENLSGENKIPNINKEYIYKLCNTFNIEFIQNGSGNLLDNIGPEDFFHYTYAILHSPSYRNRYGELLKINYPRVPFTKNIELFRSLCNMGADLVGLHLLDDQYTNASWTKEGKDSPLLKLNTNFVIRGTGSKIGKVNKNTCYQDGRVYFDTSKIDRSSYIEGISDKIWNSEIGGYQVLHKWLYDRREKAGQSGNILTDNDIEHYQRIVVSLSETVRLMQEIDDVIYECGGWPIQ